MPDPNACAEVMPPLGHGTGQLIVDGVDVGNVVILDPAGDGDDIPIFHPAIEDPLEENQYSLLVSRRVTIEATLDHMTLGNLEMLLKKTGAYTSEGFRIPFAFIDESPIHQIEVYLDVGCDGCESVLYLLLRRAFVEGPWTLPFRRESWTEYVVRFIGLPDRAFPESPFGYVLQVCPQAAS
jgi:hypothetical protein